MKEHDVYFEDKPCDQGRCKASPYGLCSFSPQLLRRVETQRYNIGRPYGTRREDYGYGCLIDILISTVPTPLLLHTYSIAGPIKNTQLVPPGM